MLAQLSKIFTLLQAASATKLESATSIKAGSKTELEAKKAGDEDSDEEIAKREGLPEVSFGQILGLNSPEWFYIFVGSFFACFNGAVQPIWAIIFSGVLEDYSTYNCAYNKEIVALTGSNTSVAYNADFSFVIDVDEVKANTPGCDLEKFRNGIYSFSLKNCQNLNC